jgi:hypothetical protein
MTGPLCIGDPSLPPTPLISCYLKNQTRLSNPDQLLLQDLSDSSAADRGEYRQAAGAIAGLKRPIREADIEASPTDVRFTPQSRH